MRAKDKQIGGDHYQKLAIQPTEFIHRNGIPFIEGNVIKYVCRHRDKNGRADIEKAIHYLQLLIEFEYDTKAMASNHPDRSDDSGIGLDLFYEYGGD